MKKYKEIIGTAVLFAVFEILTFLRPVYAVSFDSVKNGISEPLSVVLVVVGALGPLMLLIALIQYMVSDNPQAGAQAKKRIFTILIAWIALLATLAITKEIVNLANAGMGNLYNGQIK